MTLHGRTVLFGLAGVLCVLCVMQKRIGRVWHGFLLASPFLLAAALLGLVRGEGGLAWSAFLVAKLLVIVIWTQWLLAEFRESDLTGGLRQLRVPHIFAATIFFIFRYRGILREELAELRRARALRGGVIRRKSFHLGEYRILGDVIGAGLVRSLDRGDRVYQAMRLRGLTPAALVETRTGLGKDLWRLAGVAAAAAGLIGLNRWIG